MTATATYTITPVARLPLPISRWRRWWLKLLRRPLPLEPAPPGTQSVWIDWVDADGVARRLFVPCARVEPQEPHPCL